MHAAVVAVLKPLRVEPSLLACLTELHRFSGGEIGGSSASNGAIGSKHGLVVLRIHATRAAAGVGSSSNCSSSSSDASFYRYLVPRGWNEEDGGNVDGEGEEVLEDRGGRKSRS